MKRIFCLYFFVLVFHLNFHGQSYYPALGQPWQTTTFEDAGWCSDSLSVLLDYLELQDTKAFIVLYDGKIIVEQYFDTFTEDSLWYWASAGKTLTSALVGIAEQDFNLNLDAPTSNYLGQGWSSLTTEQELAITVRNQLSMTTGLNDYVTDSDCTNPECLQYSALPGTRWAYHNAPYTLLDDVLGSVSGLNINALFSQKIGIPCGISGLYFPNGDFNKVFISTPRNMAKFGLLLQSSGQWSGQQIIPLSYFNQMVAQSQEMNDAYGYLTWLNNGSLYMIPGPQIQIPGIIAEHAPLDMFAGLGKNGQVVCAAPSKNLTFIRMGNGSNELISLSVISEIWEKMRWFFCSTPVETNSRTQTVVYNNGGKPYLRLAENCSVEVFNVLGTFQSASLEGLTPGVYSVLIHGPDYKEIIKIVVGEN